MNNLSDGKSNGIVLFYMLEGKLHPVALDQEQADMLDLIIKAPFEETPLNIIKNPVKYDAIKGMIE